MKTPTYNIQHTTYNEGFSLIELMVTISIITIVSSIILFNFPSFSSKIVLANMAHEIALSVREAQVFGIGVKQAVTTSGFIGFTKGHGVYFATNDNDLKTEGKVTKFISFADRDGDGLYDANENLETISIQRGISITDICYDVDCLVDRLDITFTRPDPEAHIFVNGVRTDRSFAQITITSPGSEGGSRIITVWASGQISVTSE